MSLLEARAVREVLDRALAGSAADQTEALLMEHDLLLTRFAGNRIHQNMGERDRALYVRAVCGKRIGVASTNDLAAGSISATVARAVALARLCPEDPHFTSLPGPQAYGATSAWSEDTAICSPEQQAAMAAEVCRQAEGRGLSAAGACSISLNQTAVANSLGLRAHSRGTLASLSTVVSSSTSSGYAGVVSSSVGQVSAEATAAQAIDKALRGANPRPLEPGQYDVILEEEAVGDILDFIGMLGLGARAVQEGRSFMSGRLGQRVLGENISIRDDALDPAGVPAPFDFEGVARRRLDCIVAGVARAICYDTSTAAKEGTTSTGHALLPPGAGWGPLPMNLFLAPGDATIEDMIASTRRGLLVTRFHYTRPVHPARVVVTGMTRDGTFLIENGKIAGPVKNLRFTQSYVDALNNVEMVGRTTRLTHAELSFNRVPALKIRGFTFTGATEF